MSVREPEWQEATEEADDPSRAPDVEAYLASMNGDAHVDEGNVWVEAVVPPAVVSLNGDAAAPGEHVEPFVGLTHDQVLALELAEERYLIRDLVPIAAVGTIAGVPETHKSWLAQQIAVNVAKGSGAVFGCDVAAAAPVGYFWQDDSDREEIERVKTYERANAAAGTPLHWFINKGVQLPADVPRIAATIRAHKLRLAILDSFYNFLPGVDLKDSDAERIVALLKRDLADATGCTVLIVDHMPWANETNRQRLRAYGGVFKNAATRFGIYIDANGTKLSIEARGNNIRGFKKRAAYWAADQLELRLIDTAEADTDALDEEVLAYITAHPGQATSAIATGLGKSKNTVLPSLKRLSDPGRLDRIVCKTSHDLGTAGTGRYWFPLNHAGSEASRLFQTAQDGSPRGSDPGGEASQPSPPRRGDASPTDGSLDDDEMNP